MKLSALIRQFLGEVSLPFDQEARLQSLSKRADQGDIAPVAAVALRLANDDATSIESRSQLGAALSPTVHEVADAAARLALTGLKPGDIAKEVGQVEIATVLCPASNYIPPTQGVVYFDAVACTVASGGACTPNYSVELGDDNDTVFRAVADIGLAAGSYTAEQVATAWANHLTAITYLDLTASASGVRVTVTFNQPAGGTFISVGVVTTPHGVLVAGNPHDHSNKTSITFAGQTRNVGIGGQINLPPSNQTAEQVAELVRAGFDALSNITATRSGALVTLTAETRASYTDASSINGAYTVTTVQQGVAPTNRSYLWNGSEWVILADLDFPRTFCFAARYNTTELVAAADTAVEVPFTHIVAQSGGWTRHANGRLIPPPGAFGTYKISLVLPFRSNTGTNPTKVSGTLAVYLNHTTTSTHTTKAIQFIPSFGVDNNGLSFETGTVFAQIPEEINSTKCFGIYILANQPVRVLSNVSPYHWNVVQILIERVA